MFSQIKVQKTWALDGRRETLYFLVIKRNARIKNGSLWNGFVESPYDTMRWSLYDMIT